MVQRILSSIFPLSMTGYFFCFFSFLTHVLTQNGKKYTETAEPSSPESSRFCMQCCPKWPEMVNCAILKQLITRRSQVQVLPPQPKREAKKDIEDKTSVFSRLPRPVDQQIYGPYFSDILPCAIHSGRSRTHTIFTLSGISFEAGILLLQDLGLFYSAVETDSPNRKPENKRM